MSEQVTVTFQPTGRRVSVLRDTTVLEAAGLAGLALETPCGGSGTCGKCRVRFAPDAPKATAADREALGSTVEEGWRLACRTHLQGDATIEIPSSSLIASGAQILTRSEGPAGEVDSAIRLVHVDLDEPTLDDPAADLERLTAETGAFRADLASLRAIPPVLRENGYRGTAVLADHQLIDFIPGDPSGRCFGVAIDVGTTTLAGALLDLSDGTELAVAARLNPQVRFGDDVLSRIVCAGDGKGSMAAMRSDLLEALGQLVAELADSAGVEAGEIYEATIAGNTTMQHILCGMDPTPLGLVPFAPAVARALMLRADELPVGIHPRGAVWIMPVIGGFVGGDTVAGLIATDLPAGDVPALLVDIGTNGEIVLVDGGGRLMAASTAAGPALEGARISAGMRAASGAIEKVLFDGDELRASVIGGGEAVGLCGSALMDATALLLDVGILNAEGRMLAGDELPDDVPPALADRLTEVDGVRAFRLADRADGSAVLLTQKDIRELQLAVGAIRAGIAILLRGAGIEPADLQRVCIAGGLGSFIRRSCAQRIGLIPPEIPHERIHYVGNAALHGARAALLSTGVRKRADELARGAEHVQLSQDPAFQMEYIEAMVFPESQ
ncbi:MAG: ASKHA domain-containing protein [Phycisphaerae bacterium]